MRIVFGHYKYIIGSLYDMLALLGNAKNINNLRCSKKKRLSLMSNWISDNIHTFEKYLSLRKVRVPRKKSKAM